MMYGIGVGIVRRDGERRIVAPGIGIADSDFDVLDFAQGFGAGCWRHPGQRLQARRERLLNVRNHGADFVARGGREVAVDVGFAHSVAEIAADRVERALGAWPLLRRAREGGAVECEVRVIDG